MMDGALLARGRFGGSLFAAPSAFSNASRGEAGIPLSKHRHPLMKAAAQLYS
jgi:hypothetical protein